jgi:hypothetical protein
LVLPLLISVLFEKEIEESKRRFFLCLTERPREKKKKKRVEMIREKSKNEEEEVGVNEGRGATHYIHKWMARIASF